MVTRLTTDEVFIAHTLKSSLASLQSSLHYYRIVSKKFCFWKTSNSNFLNVITF